MISTDSDAVAQKVRDAFAEGGYTPKAKLRKEVITGVAMWAATHPALYWATVHPAVVIGNKLGQDPIHERFGEAEVRYEKVSSSYTKQGKALAVQAAVGMEQLRRIEELNGARIRNGKALDVGLAHVPGLQVPRYPEGAEPIYMSFVVHHRDRMALMAGLRRRGVDTTIGYMNDHASSPLFQEYAARCPNAAAANSQQLHIPVHPNLGPRDMDHLIESVRATVLELK
jgi:dTDP-4-amino-4,6-dideoxygalactose transaminase